MIKTLREEKKQVESTLEDLESQHDLLKKEYGSLLEDDKQDEAEKKRLRAEIERLSQQSETRVKEITETNTVTTQVVDNTEELEALEREHQKAITAQKSQISKLNGQVSSLQKAHGQCENSLAQSSTAITTAKQQAAQTQAQLEASNRRVETLTTTTTTLTKNLQQAKAAMQKMQEAEEKNDLTAAHEAQVKGLEQEVAQGVATISGLRTQLETCNSDLAQSQTSITTVTTTNTNTVTSLEKTNRQHVSTIESLQSQLASCQG